MPPYCVIPLREMSRTDKSTQEEKAGQWLTRSGGERKRGVTAPWVWGLLSGDEQIVTLASGHGSTTL